MSRTCRRPSPELPYFYAANARDPRAGIVHEGAHYQQLALSNAHPNPLRRRYYDSGPNEGIAFYNEEYLLQAGLFDDAPHTRAVIWNFARLRALRVEADVHLATGAMSLDDAVDFFVRRVPMDRQTAFEESCFYAGNPGLALSYQTGKLQLMSLVAAAVRGRRRRLLAASNPRRHLARRQRPVLAAALAAARRPLGARRHRRRSGDRSPGARAGVGELMRVGAKLPNSGALPVELGIPHMARRAGGEWLRLAVGERPRRDAGDGDLAVPLRRRRCGDVGDGRSVVRLDRRPGDGRGRHRSRRAGHGRARAAAAPTRRPRQAGRQPRPARRRTGRARCRRRLAGRGVRRPGHAVRLAGRRTDEWIDLLRSCWTGRPERFDGAHYQLPADVVCEPTPARPIPILVGGTTTAALRRARQRGDGWLGIQSAGRPRRRRDRGRRSPSSTVSAARCCGSSARPRSDRPSPRRCPSLAAAGITDVVVDVDWDGDIAAQAAILLDAAG